MNTSSRLEARKCSRCVMDSSADGITFDEHGVCSYCHAFIERMSQAKAIVDDELLHKDQFIAEVKKAGRNKPYDCIVGVSGGVDSSYALYLAVKNGLRPLAVHLDNGWNSELAVHNISGLVTSLKVDLYTHVIDWEENRDLQLSFFKSNVIDIELLMDNAMLAVNYQQAAKYGLKHILSGVNLTTEGMKIPASWTHFKLDVKNIKAIHREFGKIPIRTHPLISTAQFIYFEHFKKIRWVSFLDYFPYNKQAALDILKKEVGYKPYPYKHYESVFTRFYQAYILPNKFGVDKRKVHLSSLVVTDQMSRSEALSALVESPYPDPEQERSDMEYVIKKLGFTNDTFKAYMNAPPVPHEKYPSELKMFNFYLRSGRWIKKNVMSLFKKV